MVANNIFTNITIFIDPYFRFHDMVYFGVYGGLVHANQNVSVTGCLFDQISWVVQSDAAYKEV